MPDYYKALGVERDASAETIRKAYRSLARDKHPDKGGSAEEFQVIQQAHEVLTDPDRRRMYDMTGSDAPGAPGPPGGMAAGGIPFNFMPGMGPFGIPGVNFDMSQIFGQMFGGGGPSKTRRGGTGPNKFHDVGLKLADFFTGKDIKLKFNQARRCVPCNGSGAESSESCGGCNGAGVRMITRQIGPGMMAQTRAACDVCNGEGRRTLRTCKSCQGKRFNEREKELDIKIIPGMRDGEQITFSGECSDTLDFDSPGDVVLTLRRADMGIGETDEFEWKGDDLWIRKTISFVESILGFTMTLSNHPNGESPTFVWRGGPLIHGAVLQFSEGGMPRKSGSKGTLYVQVMITPPFTTPWSAEDAAKLQSVLGGTATMVTDSPNLTLYSAESKLVVEK
jgi:DnaJ family protein A protein 2